MRRRLRVIAGSAGSVPLKGPPPGVRPTTDRVREALFNSLGDAVVGKPFVDLFAGSGAVGIEALSRGASRALFMERRRDCIKIIRENLNKVGFADLAEVVQADAYRFWPYVVDWSAGEPMFVFADPPYRDTRWPGLVDILVRIAHLPPGTAIIVEHSRRFALPDDLPPPTWHKEIGETCLSRWETVDLRRSR